MKESSQAIFGEPIQCPHCKSINTHCGGQRRDSVYHYWDIYCNYCLLWVSEVRKQHTPPPTNTASTISLQEATMSDQKARTSQDWTALVVASRR